MSAEEKAAAKASKEVEKLMEKQFKIDNSKIKLLLLGAGESGKSTIFKQMRVLFGAPLTEEEKQQITPVVYNNTITSMKILCSETKNMGYDSDVVAKDMLIYQEKLVHLHRSHNWEYKLNNTRPTLRFNPTLSEYHNDPTCNRMCQNV